MTNISRRALIKGLAAAPLVSCAAQPSKPQGSAPSSAPWHLVEQILADTKVPEFPDRDFPITQFGAVGDDQTDSTDAFAAAINRCHEAGGGRVLVPEGVFRTGPIHLKSNVNLHLQKGSVVAFYTDPQRYLPEVFTRWEGVEYMGFSPLIYAFEQENIALTGEGTLDGRANETTWWPWKGNKEWGVSGYPSQDATRAALFADADAGVPPEGRVYGEGHYLRPPFVQPYRCRNVLIEGVKVINAPFWLLNPVLCENVTVRKVTLESLGPNSDGCDPESCRNVVIEGCYFDTGDDCIAIKSGRNADGRRVNTPTENVVIRNCKMRAGHGGVVIGSEISGGVRYVFAENNSMSSPDLERGFRIKTNSIRGGLLEHLYMRDCTIGTVKDAIVINFFYEEGDAGQFDPTVRHIEIRDLICEQANRVFQIRGFDRAPIQDLRLINCEFHDAGEPGIIENVEDLVVHKVQINGRAFKL